MFKRFIPWQWELDRHAKNVSFMLVVRDLDLEEVRPLLNLDLVPFKIKKIGLANGRSILPTAINDWPAFLMQQLEVNRRFTLEGPDSFRQALYIGFGEDENSGTIHYQFVWSPDSASLVDTVIELLSPDAIQQAFLYWSDHAGLINKRTYNLYKFGKGLKTSVNHNREIVVDLSQRPGRYTRLQGGLMFRGASDYWFGPRSFEWFPKDKIMAFPYAIDIFEVKPDLVQVKLFETVFAGINPAEIWVHQAFRDYLGIDALEFN